MSNQTMSKWEKSKEFDGVLEKIYHPQLREPNGQPKFMGIKAYTRTQLLEIHSNMKKQHAAQLKSIEDVIAILDKKKGK